MATVSLSQNLEGVVRQLDSEGIVHQVVQEADRQQVWVEDPDHISYVDQLLRKRQPRNTEANPWFQAQAKPARSNRRTNGSTNQLKTLFQQFPVVVSSILLSVLGALVVVVDQGMDLRYRFIGAFTFQQVVPLVLSLKSTLAEGQVWRLITPVFLHFSFAHLAFNGMCLWLFGIRIERLLGGSKLAILILYRYCR